MKLYKTVSEEGLININIEGEELDPELSRKLTGTTNEGGAGIFAEGLSDDFEFGDFQAEISFAGRLNRQWCAEDLAERISARIRRVSDWVLDCKATAGCAEVLPHD